MDWNESFRAFEHPVKKIRYGKSKVSFSGKGIALLLGIDMNCPFSRVVIPFLSLFFAGELWAFPADPTPFTVDNACDSLTLREGGDERYSYTQTLDGYLVILDSNGIYRYATEDGLVGAFKAKNASLRSGGEVAYLQEIDKAKSRKAHFKRNSDRSFFSADSDIRKKPRWVPSLNTSDAAPVLRLPDPVGYSKGTNRFPVLLVENSSVKNYDSLAYYRQVNQEGYSLNGHIGSVKDYFSDQSNGIFLPSFDIYPVTIDGAMSDYAKKEGRLVKKAVDALLARFPDFDASKYDADGDGEIDAVGVMYAGTKSAANSMGGFAYLLQYSNSINDGVGKLNAGNGKVFNRYFILPQMSSSSELAPIAQFVHEFGHTLGLSDHYCVYASSCYYDFTDSAYQAPGVHAWDVMALGMYNYDYKSGGRPGATPVGYSAFEKAFLGWISYRTLESAWDVAILTPFYSTDVAYKIPVSGTEDEWFILENRQKIGWDALLPSHGLLIWHIDYDASTWRQDRLNDTSSHQHIDVVEAGNVKVTSASNGYYDGTSKSWFDDDPYPGSQNVTTFSPVSWNGARLGVDLYHITEKNGNICFTSGSDIPVGDCIASSSSSAESSSSSMESSSSAESSSSSMENSSSSEGTAIALTRSVKNSIELYGTTLAVSSNVFGKKLVRLYDLSGKEIFRRRFDGSTMALEVKDYSGKMLVVRLSEGERVLMLRRIVVR